ncbi:uncharacterized protein LOC126661061 [Mercurialis annua]|uniref:uncharacterized protein LOC126661061 n=1 Tax=Mercurialis annua TaxID=3986 RepID=UPI00215FE0CD|nr:uncharacterized protein LOC126661061 [Mercurialis annua]
MFNNINEQQQSLYTCSSMDPRISFSNDFVETQIKYETHYREAPVSSDFEFSVRNNSMIIPADEIFCKGKILPLKEGSTNQLRKMTLQDELLVDDDDEEYEFDVFPRVQKRSGWWKERLGLKKGDNITKKNHQVLERIVEEKRFGFVHEKRLDGKVTGNVD